MKSEKPIWALAASLLLCAANTRAQGQQQNSTSTNPGGPIPSLASSGKSNNRGPVPAARGVSQADSEDAYYSVPQAEPDTHALSGAEKLSLGALGGARNVLDVEIILNEIGDTGTPNGLGQPQLGSVTMFGGSLNFSHSWRRYRLAGFYNGGESVAFRSPNGLYQNWYQDVAIEQDMNWNRWTVRLRDDFLASPQAAFGGQNIGGPGLLGQFNPAAGIPLGAVTSGFGQSETILTGQTMRLSNTALGEADYAVSRRSMITFSGTYGLMHFTGPGYIDNHMLNTQVGYEFSLSPKSSIAFIAGYARTGYAGSDQVTESDKFNVAFGRKITGRLAFQVAGGSEQIRLYNFTPRVAPHWTWNLNTAVSYELRRTGYSLSYAHDVTSGSGVFFGARSDIFTASVHRRLTKSWTVTANAGYAHNVSLVAVGSAASVFNNWYGGANISRQVSRHATIGFNYGVQRQSANANVCPVANCGNTTLGQTFGMTLTWHPRPIAIE
jgi:hypothetical protein